MGAAVGNAQSKPEDGMTLVIKLRNNGNHLASTIIEVNDPLRCTEEILKAITKEQWVLAEGDSITIQAAE
jgi:hypothetical protein